jgi:hypothetical protein
MESEWDILAEIRATLNHLTLESSPSFEHIKGHQDDRVPLEELPLSAQMNCEADKWADEYLTQYPDKDHTHVPLLPTAGCQLNLPHGTITYNLKRALTLARHAPPMRAKLCHKNEWSDADFDNINWTAHGRALHYLGKHKTTLIKYLNDVLPLGALVNQYDARYSEECPSCPETRESRDHFWHCPAKPRREWRKQCQGNLLKLLNSLDTAQPLQQLYLDAMDVLINGKPIKSIPVDPAVAHVAEAQAQIGWHHILKGRFVHHWSEVQAQYLGSKATNTANGDTWITKLITGWFQEWLKLWKSRNDDRHGKDYESQQQAKDGQNFRNLQLFYEKHDTIVTPRLRWLFDISLRERIEDGNIRSARIWMYTSWQPVVERSYTTSLETG